MPNDTLNELRIDSVRLSWLKDNAGERLMPRTLFPDAPDSLITGLGSTESRLPTALAAM